MKQRTEEILELIGFYAALVWLVFVVGTIVIAMTWAMITFWIELLS